MKTKTLFKSIATVLVLLAFTLLVTVSCKKNDDTPPDPDPDPTPSVMPSIFQYGFVKMMTDDEIMNNKKYIGSYFYEFGHGIMGEDDIPDIPYSEILSTILDIEENHVIQADFEKVDRELDTISGQITELQNEIGELCTQLAIVETDLTTQMQNLANNSYITDINNAFDNGTSQSLRYYSSTALQITAGTYPITMHQLDSIAMKDFVANYGPSATGNPMPIAISQIQVLILGSTGSAIFANSDLKTFADLIIQNQTSSRTDPAYAMNCYKILENYFLMSLNSQFRALTVWGNALYRAEDSILAQHDFQTYIGDFSKIIESELSMFLTVTDYLSINLIDYRNESNFTSDAQTYFTTGLRPDYTCGPFIARANMLNQLITYGLGLKTKDVYVTVSVPKNYGNSAPLTWDGYPLAIDNSGELKSQFPYTGWQYEVEAVGTSSPDNIVTFYRGNGGDGGSANHESLTQIGIAISGAPWRHSDALSGMVKFAYYNPKDINAPPQVDWSTTYCLAFASASSCWYWGYLWLNDNSNNNMFAGTNVFWQNPSENDAGVHNSPILAELDKQHDYSNDSPYNEYFSHGDDVIGYSGQFPKSSSNSSDMSIGQCRTAVINIGATTVPADLGAGIKQFFTFEVEVFNWSRSEEFYFAGSNLSDGNTLLNADLLNYYCNTTPKLGVTSYNSVALTAGVKTFYVGFFSQNPGETGNSNSCYIKWHSQIIYLGKYEIF